MLHQRLMVCISLGIFLSGCTFINQDVKIQPEFSTSSSSIGNGIEVALRVVDERESADIGKRGNGMVKGGTIKTDQDIIELFSEQIKKGLTAKGFKVTEFSTSAPIILKGELRSLAYDTSMGLWTGESKVQSSFKIVAQNGDQTYEKMYRGLDSIRTFWVPSQETNSKTINDSINKVLEDIFSDNELLEFLSKK